MKVCTVCGKSKELDEFSVDKRNKDGKRQPCKECARAASRKYAQRPEAKEKAAKRMAEWRKRNPELNRERYHTWLNTPEGRAVARKASRRWAASNPDKRKAAETRWREANKPRKSELQMRREARKRNQFVAPVDPEDILIRDRGHCGICGDPIMEPYHLDHIHPLAAGGTHEPNNVQLAHPACNWRKGASLSDAA